MESLRGHQKPELTISRSSVGTVNTMALAYNIDSFVRN